MLEITPGGSVSFKKPIKNVDPSRGGWADRPVDECVSWIVEHCVTIHTVVMSVESLQDSLSTDPKHANIDIEVGPSQFEENLFRMEKKEVSAAKVGRHVKRLCDGKVKTGSRDKDSQIRSQVEEAVYRAYDMLHFPKEFLKKKLSFLIDAKVNGMKKRDASEFARESMVDLLVPKIYLHSERKIPLVAPFNLVKRSDLWRQWFFLDRGIDRIDWISPDPHSDRYLFWSELCAKLTEYGYAMQTTLISVDRLNKFRKVREYDSFKYMIGGAKLHPSLKHRCGIDLRVSEVGMVEFNDLAR